MGFKPTTTELKVLFPSQRDYSPLITTITLRIQRYANHTRNKIALRHQTTGQNRANGATQYRSHVPGKKPIPKCRNAITKYVSIRRFLFLVQLVAVFHAWLPNIHETYAHAASDYANEKS